MVWFKVDDGFYSSRKVLSIPRPQRLAAVGLWTMAGNWCARELTDGVVPAYVLAELGATPRLRRALVEAGLWLDQGSDGIEFSNWAQYQPTRADVEADRVKAAQRQAKWRERRRGETGFEGVGNAVTDAVTNGGSDGAPTRPNPTRPITSTSDEVEGRPRKRATRIPEPFIVTADMRSDMHAEYPQLDINHSTKQFVDYWRSASGKNALKKEWVAAWRFWIRRDGQATSTPRSGQQPRRTRDDENLAVVARLAAQEAAAQKGLTA